MALAPTIGDSGAAGSLLVVVVDLGGEVVLKVFDTEAAAEATAAENLSSADESPRVKNPR